MSTSLSLGQDTEATKQGSWKDASFQLQQRGTDRYQLTMDGYLTTGWMGRLAAGLVRSRLGIIGGEAEKISATTWHASFEISRHPLAPEPFGIDFLACANEEQAAVPAGSITLHDFVVEPSSRHGGCLYVEVTGLDRLGFLDALLAGFSMNCLFPVQMTIDTVGNEVFDRFWLKGMAGSRPSEPATLALRQWLERQMR